MTPEVQALVDVLRERDDVLEIVVSEIRNALLPAYGAIDGPSARLHPIMLSVRQQERVHDALDRLRDLAAALAALELERIERERS